MNELGINSEHFEKIWNEVICVAEKVVLSDCDSSFLTQCKVKSNSTKKDYGNSVYKTYIQIRQDLKDECYGKDSPGSLDFRKISAVLTKTLISQKMFSFDISEAAKILSAKYEEIQAGAITKLEYNRWAVSNVLINYKLAYLVSVQFLYLMLLSELLEKEETVYLADKLNSLGHLKNYPLPEGSDTFDTNIIIGLLRAEVGKRDLDVFLLSQHYYQLEMYTRQWLELSDSSR